MAWGLCFFKSQIAALHEYSQCLISKIMDEPPHIGLKLI